MAGVEESEGLARKLNNPIIRSVIDVALTLNPSVSKLDKDAFREIVRKANDEPNSSEKEGDDA